MRRLDVVSGVATDVDLDEGKMIIRRVQDLEPVLDHHKRMATENDGYSPSRDIRRVASIPLVVVEQWMNEGVDIFDPNSREEIKRRLNDPDNQFLRTAPGRL